MNDRLVERVVERVVPLRLRREKKNAVDGVGGRLRHGVEEHVARVRPPVLVEPLHVPQLDRKLDVFAADVFETVDADVVEEVAEFGERRRFVGVCHGRKRVAA